MDHMIQCRISLRKLLQMHSGRALCIKTSIMSKKRYAVCETVLGIGYKTWIQSREHVQDCR